MIKSRKTPQQKLIFQIGSLNPTVSTKSFIELIYSCLFRDQVPSNRKASFPVSKSLTIYNSSILGRRANAQASAFEAIHGGQFASPTHLIIVKYWMRLVMILS